MMKTDKQDLIREKVRQRYASVAVAAPSKKCGCASNCCTPDVSGNPASLKLGYSKKDRKAVPEGADMGLGCGNPQAIANLKRGEVAVDLGAGGGFDCFLAARQVGPRGFVIGVDMTPEMVSKARANVRKSKFRNIEFRLGEIEHLPVADGVADLVMSNCVINLSPDKPRVYREAYRVLKPGGRLAISDVVAIKRLPAAIRTDLDKHGGCVSGAALVGEVERMLRDAGFVQIRVAVNEASVLFIKDWFPGSGVERYVRSAVIEACKRT
jgi:SAM-dependent methyltransferase